MKSNKRISTYDKHVIRIHTHKFVTNNIWNIRIGLYNPVYRNAYNTIEVLTEGTQSGNIFNARKLVYPTKFELMLSRKALWVWPTSPPTMDVIPPTPELRSDFLPIGRTSSSYSSYCSSSSSSSSPVDLPTALASDAGSDSSSYSLSSVDLPLALATDADSESSLDSLSSNLV